MRQWMSAALALCACSHLASAQIFDFTLNAPPSGLSGTAGIDIDTTGTLVGNWDPTSNPEGTRTKPGLFGTFGATENVPVNVTLGVGATGPINSRASGGFRLSLEADGGLVNLSNYAVNLLSTGPVTLPINLSLLYDSFRTRNPTSTYIGGVPLTIPFGEASLTRLDAEQLIPAQGSLVTTGPGTYDFSIIALVNLTAEFSFLGNTFAIPAVPTPLLLEGQLSINGSTAQFLSVQPFAFSNSVEPGVAIPQFPLELPTILPPGLIANVLFDLTLDAITASLDTTLTTNATGVLVPAPASLALLGFASLLPRRRR
ncbi:MAG: hypothetical protein KF678_09730 [Phycisphaeraceae bacterium]|nr:hypothetical protein [Phycisphaeraceae bacterium]